MYKKNIAAAAAVLFFSASFAVSASAAPVDAAESKTEETEEATAGFIPEEETGLSDLEEETEEEEEEEEEIQSPVVEKTFRLFRVETIYALSKRNNVYFYEDMDETSDPVGEIDAYGVLHLLSEETDGWYYAESGNVRGFVKANNLLTGKKAEKYIKSKREENLETAKMQKEPADNEAFLYTQTTGYDVVVRKRYALAQENLEILDRIPKEEEEESDGEAKKEEETEEEPVVVGTLVKNGLCYILDEEDGWYYVESDDVRGFVKEDALQTGSQVRREVKEAGEDAYPLAEELVAPEENRACYYTTTSVKEASVSGLIRSSMIEYAEQFLGNPYVWGGTSLTDGADCSGFVQSIYAQFGYQIPRTAEEQADCAQKIPVEDALPGDLIFYEDSESIDHVVMYTGDGGTIEAMGSEYGIVESTVNDDKAVWAVRIISDDDTDILDQLRKNDLAVDYYNEAVIAQAEEYGSYLGKFKITAYCSCPLCCGIWSDGITASGSRALENRTAATAVLPFGTEVIINGQVYTVEDRGTPYGQIDIYMNSHAEAQQFGVQYADVYLKN